MSASHCRAQPLPTPELRQGQDALGKAGTTHSGAADTARARNLLTLAPNRLRGQIRCFADDANFA